MFVIEWNALSFSNISRYQRRKTI